MIISIDDELFQKVKQIVKGRNLTLFNELESIKPLDTVATDTTDTTDTTLAKAREIKTQRIKESIKETIKSLHSQDIQPTKYKINKRTGISFITINKYYQSILNEVKNEIGA